MTSNKQIVKDAFINEIKNTSLYKETFLNLNKYIIDEIIRPNVVSSLVYKFSQRLTDEEAELFKLIILFEYGFYNLNMNNDCIVIEMAKFLE